MKNSLLKFHIVVIYLCSTFAMFADPGTTDTAGTMENTDTPTAPIDENLWILAMMGFVFVFIKLKSVKLKEIVVKA